MRLRSFSDKRGFLIHVLPVLLYAVALFLVGASHTGFEIPEDWVPRDKLNHFGAFGLFVWLAYWALSFELPTKSAGVLLWLSTLASSSFGALLECWQLLFPYRSAEVLDWVADTLGAIVAGSVAFFWIGWHKRRLILRR